MLSELDITLGLFGVFYKNLNWAQNWAQMQKWILNNGENPVISMVRLAGIEPAHPVPETGALSPEL